MQKHTKTAHSVRLNARKWFNIQIFIKPDIPILFHMISTKLHEKTESFVIRSFSHFVVILFERKEKFYSSHENKILECRKLAIEKFKPQSIIS